MGWLILFCLGGLAWWLLHKHIDPPQKPHQPPSPPPDQPPARAPLNLTLTVGSLRDIAPQQWHDPLDDIDPDSVVYNGYKSTSARVRVRYTSGKGETSEREVDIQSYDDTTGIGMFEGFCHLRGMRRSFYFARVTQAVDAESGEIIGDLRIHLNRLWEQGTGPALRLLNNERKLDLEILLFMAKADTAMRAAELEIITRYCQEVTGDMRLDTATIRKALDFTHLTSLHGFKIKVGELLKSRPDDAARVAALCRAIVATQKTVHPGEQAALEYLDRKIPSPTSQ